MIEMVGADYSKSLGFHLHFCEWPEFGALRIPIEDAEAAILAIARAHGLIVKIAKAKVISVPKRAAGGRARMAQLSPEERSAFASAGGNARWAVKKG
jgi:hypothetical protein